MRTERKRSVYVVDGAVPNEEGEIGQQAKRQLGGDEGQDCAEVGMTPGALELLAALVLSQDPADLPADAEARLLERIRAQQGPAQGVALEPNGG